MRSRPPLHIETDGNLPGGVAPFSLSVPHGSAFVFSGSPGSGKTTVRRAIELAIQGQQALLEQIQGRSPISALPTNESRARVHNAVPCQLLDGAAQYISGARVAEFLSADWRTRLLAPAVCPSCSSTAVLPYSGERYAAWLIESQPEARCSVTCVCLQNSSNTFADSDELFAWLTELDIFGRSRVLVDGTAVDLDDPLEREELFPLAVGKQFEVVYDRLILRPNQAERLAASIREVLDTGHDALIHCGQTLCLHLEATHFCGECGTTFSRAGAAEAPVCFGDLAAASERLSRWMLCDGFPEQLRTARLDLPVSCLTAEAFQMLQLTQILARPVSDTILMCDHTPAAAWRAPNAAVQYFLDTALGAGNTILFFTHARPESLGFTTQHHRLAPPGRSRPGIRSPALSSTFDATIRPHTVCRIDTVASEWISLARRGELCAIPAEDGSLSVLPQAQNAEPAVTVQYHNARLASSDTVRMVSAISGFEKGITALYGKLPAARQHGLTARDFLAVMRGNEAAILPLSIRYHGYTIIELVSQTTAAAGELTRNIPACAKPLATLLALGLGHLPLSRPLSFLSQTEQIMFALARLILKSKKNACIIIPDFAHLIPADDYAQRVAELTRLCKQHALTLLIATHTSASLSNAREDDPHV